jgi:hypothetical protein
MGYKKKFSEDKNKVTITAIGESRGFWDRKKGDWVKEKTFEVVRKEEIYEKIKNGELIELEDKYVKGFSLCEYRGREGLEEHEEVKLKDFNAEGAFFEAGVDFSNAVFDGDVYFSDANFGDGDIRFWRVEFGDGKVSFRRATFGEGDVSFSKVNFGDGDTSFSYAYFGNGKVAFKGANFGDGNIYFNGTNFRGENISFSGANFGSGETSFRFTKFEGGKVSFKRTKLKEGNAYFSQSEFGEENVSFYRADFGGSSLQFVNIKTQGDWDMRVRQADILEFSGSKIHGNIDLGVYHWKERKEKTPQINELRLINTKLYGKIYMDYTEFKLGRAINSQQDTIHREKKEQFRLLKENFRNLGQYDDEDKAYVQFMWHKIRAEGGFDIPISVNISVSNIFKAFYKYPIERSIPFYLRYYRRFCRRIGHMGKHTPFIQRAIRFPVFAFKWLVFEQMGLYGTSPARVALSMLITLGLFILAYIPFASPINLPENISSFSGKLINAFYHSVITFLTIGYGHDYINPQILLGRILSGLEGFAGLFLMSYFTISFVRKVLR